MQRRKCREPLQTRDHPMVDQHGPIVIRTAMDDAMADSERAQLKFVPQPGAREHQGGRNVRNTLDRIGPVRHTCRLPRRWRAAADGCRSRPSGP